MKEFAYEILSETTLEIGHYISMANELYRPLRIEWDDTGKPILSMEFINWGWLPTLDAVITVIGSFEETEAPTMQALIEKLKDAGFACVD